MPAVTIYGVRFSYVNVFQPKPPRNNPSGDPKFSVTIIVPKTNTQAKLIMDQAVAAAIDSGVSTKWNGVRPPQPAICIHDGDGVRPSDGQPFGEECKGCWVFTASSKADQPPFVVDAQVQPIIDPTKVYSGMWGNVSVSFFPYNNAGKKGIGCGLNGLQKTRDDEPLSARVTAQDAFQPVAAAPMAAPMAAPAAAPTMPGYGAGQYNGGAAGMGYGADQYGAAGMGFGANQYNAAGMGFGAAPQTDPYTGRPM